MSRSNAPDCTRLLRIALAEARSTLLAQTVDDVHHQRLPVHLYPGNPDISIAAAAAFHDIAPFREKRVDIT